MIGVARGRRGAPGRAPLLAAALAVTMMAASGGAAVDLEGALAALERGEFEVAVPALEALAEQGDMRAQDALGALYLQGIGVEADVARAMQWYCRVAHDANGGRPVMHAVWLLAEYFRTGGGVPGSRYLDGSREREDPIKAYFWFSVMANQGALYRETDSDSVTLGKMGMSAVGRELYDDEKATLERAVAAWDPAAPIGSAQACLALPDGLPGG